jgi:hypothetical protein
VICALARSPVSGVVIPPVRKEVMHVARKTMEEVLSVARALGYGEDVLPAKAVDRAMAVRSPCPLLFFAFERQFG